LFSLPFLPIFSSPFCPPTPKVISFGHGLKSGSFFGSPTPALSPSLRLNLITFLGAVFFNSLYLNGLPSLRYFSHFLLRPFYVVFPSSFWSLFHRCAKGASFLCIDFPFFSLSPSFPSLFWGLTRAMNYFWGVLKVFFFRAFLYLPTTDNRQFTLIPTIASLPWRVRPNPPSNLGFPDRCFFLRHKSTACLPKLSPPLLSTTGEGRSRRSSPFVC